MNKPSEASLLTMILGKRYGGTDKSIPKRNAEDELDYGIHMALTLDLANISG